MEHDDELVIAHTQQLSTMKEQITGIQRRMGAVEDCINRLEEQMSHNGWMLAAILGGVVVELALQLLKH